MKNWYQQTTSQVLSEVETTMEGLAGNEADNRLREHGLNTLDCAKQKSLLRVLANSLPICLSLF